MRFKLVLPACFLVTLTACLAADAPLQPIEIGSQKQLFLDEYVFESIGPGVFLIVNQPLKYEGNPVIRMDRPWEAAMRFGNSTDVLYDAEDKLFKMWSQVVNYDWSENLLAYYTSKDGLRWEKPSVGQFDYQPSTSAYRPKAQPTRKHNFVFGGSIPLGAPGVFRDGNEKDPQKRYKVLYRRREPKRGVWAAHSPDGIRWTDYPAELNPVFLDNDTHQVVFWDAKRRQYVAHIRLWPPIFKDDPRMRGGVGLGSEGRVRAAGIATSLDFIHWDAPKDMRDPVEVNQKYILLAPDERDLPCTRGFYTFETLQYEGVYIAFASSYQSCTGMERAMPPVRGNAQSEWIDKIDIQLAFSRDGKSWQRAADRRPFLPNGPPGSYDAGMIFVAQAPVVREDLGEIWIYYMGDNGTHWAVARGENYESTINLAKLRLDGFVSLTGGQGSATTRRLIFSGDTLRINALTAGDEGNVSVEILDPQTSRPFPGFGKQDCDSFRGDDIRHAVTWKGRAGVGGLAGKPVKLRFHLERAKLFSFQFVKKS